MSTNLSFEEIAEDYCAEFSDYNLVEIAKEGVSTDLLEEWLASEYPEETFDEEDINDFLSCIINYAEFIVNERKRDAADELRSSIETVVSDSCGILEDYELASIFADYVTTYLRTNL